MVMIAVFEAIKFSERRQVNSASTYNLSDSTMKVNSDTASQGRIQTLQPDTAKVDSMQGQGRSFKPPLW